MLETDPRKYAEKLHAFLHEANEILGTLESAESRKVTLDHSYKTLTNLTLTQDDLFRQALRCVEVRVFRAAHVMAWAGLVDCLQQLVASDNFSALNTARPSWQIVSLDQLREGQTEFALIDAIHKMGAIGKSESKALHGMLSKRNECAHPTQYYPSFNETLGYISEIFSRLLAIQNKYPAFVLK